MPKIKFLKYASNADFDASQNKEYKAPVPTTANILGSMVKGKSINTALWLGSLNDVSLFHLLLNDGSSILVSQAPDGATQVVHRPGIQ